MSTPTITTRQLQQLRPGAKLKVTLQSGRVVEGVLRSYPEMRCVGKPGIHRVRLSVLDTKHAARISDRSIGYLAEVHTISGDHVVEVLA